MTSSKKIASMGVAMAALLAIGGTFAYYTSEQSIDNTMETGVYGDTVTEVFTPDSNWEPGEEADKIVGVTNTGDYDIVVRVSMSETWYDESGNELISLDITEVYDASNQDDEDDGLVADDGSVVFKALAESGWTYDDGYWYYDSVLASGESTGALLSSITLAEDTDMGVYESTTYYVVTDSETLTADQEDVTYEGSQDEGDEGFVWITLAADASLADVEVEDGEYLHVKSISTLTEDYEGYAGATYVLTITSETVQATEDAVLATFDEFEDDSYEGYLASSAYKAIYVGWFTDTTLDTYND